MRVFKAIKRNKLLKSNMKKVLLLLLCFSWFSACTEGGASEMVNKAKVTEEVEARLDAFVNALNSGDATGLPDYYSQSERFYWVEDGQITYPDHATLAASLQGLYTSLESAQMRVLERRIEVLNHHRVNIYTEYEQDLKMKSGYAFSINGAMTVLLEMEEGVWRYIIGHSSTKKERGG
jgi:hypothetical protein